MTTPDDPFHAAAADAEDLMPVSAGGPPWRERAAGRVVGGSHSLSGPAAAEVDRVIREVLTLVDATEPAERPAAIAALIDGIRQGAASHDTPALRARLAELVGPGAGLLFHSAAG